jgi:hypothetical protein
MLFQEPHKHIRQWYCTDGMFAFRFKYLYLSLMMRLKAISLETGMKYSALFMTNMCWDAVLKVM